MKRSYLYFLWAAIFFSACTSNTFDDISEPMEVLPDEENVTFEDVRFVFENVCQVCHSNPPQNGAPMPLVSYDDVRDAVLDRGLLDRISREEGAPGLMPLGGPRLPQETIDLIMQWNADGLPEN
ncbi:MAG: hypothetical protein KTR22_03700 [Flavobacteriaceae bacterium]|nr:hypothetical protein [Flavobacteriaceae bacterium]